MLKLKTYSITRRGPSNGLSNIWESLLFFFAVVFFVKLFKTTTTDLLFYFNFCMVFFFGVSNVANQTDTLALHTRIHSFVHSAQGTAHYTVHNTWYTIPKRQYLGTAALPRPHH
jgi:hypothetical protein